MTASGEIAGLGRVYAKCDDCGKDNLNWFETCEDCGKTICKPCYRECFQCISLDPLCRDCCQMVDIPVLVEDGSPYNSVILCKKEDCRALFEERLGDYGIDRWLFALGERKKLRIR